MGMGSVPGAQVEGVLEVFLHAIYSSPNRKWQEANQKIQELQASQEARTDQEQKIKVGCSVSGPACVLQAFQGWS